MLAFALAVVEFADGAELGEGGERLSAVIVSFLLVLLAALDGAHLEHLLLGAQRHLGHGQDVSLLQQVHLVLLKFAAARSVSTRGLKEEKLTLKVVQTSLQWGQFRGMNKFPVRVLRSNLDLLGDGYHLNTK